VALLADTIHNSPRYSAGASSSSRTFSGPPAARRAGFDWLDDEAVEVHSADDVVLLVPRGHNL